MSMESSMFKNSSINRNKNMYRRSLGLGLGLREFHRFKVNYDFKYSFNDRESKCEILNISEGGMLIKVPQILDVDDVLVIYIDEETPKRIQLRAVVRHTNYNYVGIKYLFDDDLDREIVNSFMFTIKDKNKIQF